MRMKAKYQADLENSKGGGDIADELRKEVQSLRHRVEQLESELESKNEEIQKFLTTHKSDISIVSCFIRFNKIILLSLFFYRICRKRMKN